MRGPLPDHGCVPPGRAPRGREASSRWWSRRTPTSRSWSGRARSYPSWSF